ncbi:MAG: arginine--tRNA ligase, partial [Oscillospiraceae bacterium]|nr:arginine--tRNA ligase [Oscillospiraceae bacterium]
MTNMIQKAKDQVQALTETAYQKAVSEGKLPGGVQVRCGVEIPKDTANGDYTTTFALAAAKAMKKRPREIAGILLENMDLTDSYFTSVEIAGAGFLNFRLANKWCAGVLNAVDS